MQTILGLALSSVILLTFQLNADPNTFSGEWKGKGTYIYDGDLTQCSAFEMGFKATKTRFVFNEGFRNCDKHKEKFSKVTMRYKNGKLFYGGQEVGSYDGQTLEARYRMLDGSRYRVWRMFMRRQGDHLMYEESRRMEGDDTPLISFSGLMIKTKK